MPWNWKQAGQPYENTSVTSILPGVLVGWAGSMRK